jgi:hypothetical protein
MLKFILKGGNKMKKILSLCILLLLILNACQKQETKTYSNSGEHWIAKVRTSSGDDKERYMLTLRYKGDDIESVGDFEFKVTSSKGQWGMGIIQIDNQGEFVEEGFESKTIEVLNSNKFEITINWNEQSETIHLERLKEK